MTDYGKRLRPFDLEEFKVVKEAVYIDKSSGVGYPVWYVGMAKNGEVVYEDEDGWLFSVSTTGEEINGCKIMMKPNKVHVVVFVCQDQDGNLFTYSFCSEQEETFGEWVYLKVGDELYGETILYRQDFQADI